MERSEFQAIARLIGKPVDVNWKLPSVFANKPKKERKVNSDNLQPFKFYKDSCGKTNYVGVVLAEDEKHAKEIVAEYFSDNGSGFTIENEGDHDITIEPVISSGDGIIVVDKY